MKRLLLAALLAAVLPACESGELQDDPGESESNLAPGCKWPVQVVFWGARYENQLLDQIEAHATPCATYWVSLPPIMDDAGRKTVPRKGNLLDRIHAMQDRGIAIRAMAEFHWTSWNQWVAATGNSWYDAGVEFRQRMVDQGYQPDRGDTWALNELPSSVRRGEAGARDHARNAVRGLYEGTGPKAKGSVFIIGMGQKTANLSVYKPDLENWLCDGAFWDEMNRDVRFWGQEVYPDPYSVCVGGTTIAERSAHVNLFTEHVPKLAEAGPSCAAKARSFFDHAYTPLLGASWRQEIGYGNTMIDRAIMKQFLALQVYATRAWAGKHPYLDGRIGFAWASRNYFAGLNGPEPEPDFVLEMTDLATRLMDSIQHAYGPDGTAARACSDSGSLGACGCTVSGAAFNDAWETFGSW